MRPRFTRAGCRIRRHRQVHGDSRTGSTPVLPRCVRWRQHGEARFQDREPADRIHPHHREALTLFTAVLRIDGIPVETTRAGHVGEIDIQSFSWSEAQAAGGTPGGTTGCSKVAIQAIHCTTYVNKSSPLLMHRCAAGSRLNEAVSSLQGVSGPTMFDLLRIALVECWWRCLPALVKRVLQRRSNNSR